METEATPETAPAAEQANAPVTRAQMLAWAEARAKATEEPTPQPAADEEQAQGDDKESKAEGEQEEEASDKPEDEEKKLGKIGKLKAKFRAEIAEKEAELGRLSERDSKWREGATRLLHENDLLRQQLEHVSQLLKAHNVELDPRETRIMELETQERLREQTEKMRREQAEQNQRAQAAAQVTAKARELVESARTIAATSGVEAPALMAAYDAVATANEAVGKKPPTLAEVAKILQAQRLAEGQRPAVDARGKQREINRAAPSPLTGGTSQEGPRRGFSRSDMLSWYNHRKKMQGE